MDDIIANFVNHERSETNFRSKSGINCAGLFFGGLVRADLAMNSTKNDFLLLVAYFVVVVPLMYVFIHNDWLFRLMDYLLS